MELELLVVVICLVGSGNQAWVVKSSKYSYSPGHLTSPCKGVLYPRRIKMAPTCFLQSKLEKRRKGAEEQSQGSVSVPLFFLPLPSFPLAHCVSLFTFLHSFLTLSPTPLTLHPTFYSAIWGLG